MDKDLELFFERLLTDSTFRDKFLEAKTALEGYELAKEYIPDVSFEEFKEGILITDKKLKEEARESRALSIDEATGISGGDAKYNSASDLIKLWS
jgi:hypothetical protein